MPLPKPNKGETKIFDRCAAQHFGPWMIEPTWFVQAVAAVRAGEWTPDLMAQAEDEDAKPYDLDDAGLAMIGIHGQMTKGQSSFGGTSTVAKRLAIREAVEDESVKAILLHIDSPGGTVAGTAELASEVARADRKKPVYAYAEDIAASAAYWIASQAREISANATGRIGSIGALLMLEDSSGKAEKAGVRVIPISTGPYKAAFADGTPITDEQVEYAQTTVDDLNEHFLQGVKRGRHLSMEKVKEVADGRLHIAAKAQELKLIDRVETLDDTVAGIRKDLKKAAADQRRQNRMEILTREHQI